MSRLITSLVATCCAVVACVGPTRAESDHTCRQASSGPWLAIEDARTALAAQGFDVRKIESEDGCYEAHAVDKGGERVKLYLDPTSLKIVGRKDRS